jgi:tetratricopeptide (TPR) repeat protein
MVNQELISADTSELAIQARAAYEQKRIRECLSLTKTLLEADPENSEAQTLQSAIRADIRQDLHDARGLLEQSGTKDEKKKYYKAAEIILIKSLNVDPENKEAKMLLQSARAMSGGAQQSVSMTPETPQVSTMPQVAQTSENPEDLEDLPFTVAPPLVRKKEEKKSRLKIPVVAVGIVVLIGGLLLIRHFRRTNPDTLAASVERAESVRRPTTASTQYPPAPAPAEVTPPSKPPVSTQTPVAATAAPAPASSPTTAAGTPPGAGNATSEMGRLAVSSTIPAEIYLGNKNLGSTPTTVQLPAGRQTLEYRHGDLRTVVNHTIKANETISAAITFQVTVQINAKPWAQVFLEGTPRRPLGQTPLSGITVPVSSVLVFENPNFPSKTYRVTEKDSAVQVDFP